MTLNEIAAQVHRQAIESGFYPVGREFNVGEKLMLIVSELGEALEADRTKKRIPPGLSMGAVCGWVKDKDFRSSFEKYVKDTFEDEIADAIIRILDLVAALSIDIDAHVQAKMRYNAGREFRHGGKAY
jgi:NTP pyrophosphatase (non-canonical NTP hydrolase)